MECKDQEPKPSICLKDADASDIDFARTAHRLAYQDVVLRQFGEWDEEFQSNYFKESWSNANYKIIYFGGDPCGYTRIEQKEEFIKIYELVIIPDYQNQGIGSHILTETQSAADKLNLPIELEVLKENAAIHLYSRFGFQVVGQSDTHYMMRWNSDRQSS